MPPTGKTVWMLQSKIYDFFVFSLKPPVHGDRGEVAVTMNDRKGVQEKGGKKKVVKDEVSVSIEAFPWWCDNLAHSSAF